MERGLGGSRVAAIKNQAPIVKMGARIANTEKGFGIRRSYCAALLGVHGAGLWGAMKNELQSTGGFGVQEAVEIYDRKVV